MAATNKPELFVVDGSNIATEGRTAPSLEQLNDAVMAFLDAHPQATVTVVVDATFGHRIAKKEVKAFDEAVANNELVTPPAGAVGRGDAFVLAIADRAKAGVLSNDSFQEFHGEYEWLFDEGRLIGGKPVPHVGWVFVKRSPVRGPRSRQAMREAGEDAKGAKERANRRVRKKTADAPAGVTAAEASDGEVSIVGPVDGSSVRAATESATEPTKRGRRGRGRRKSAEPIGPEQQATIEAAKAAAPREHVNDLLPFLEFVEQHPVGTSCTAVVDSYASHGAYAKVDDVLVYIPLRLMDDPAPRSARAALAIGEAITTVIVGYVADRRSIDAALPHMAGGVAGSPKPADGEADTAGSTVGAGIPSPEGTTVDSVAAEQTGRRKGAAAKQPAKKAAAAKQTAPTKAPAKKAAASKQAAPAKTAAAKTAAPTKAAAATKAPTKAPAKAPARKAAATKQAAPAKKVATRSQATESGAAGQQAAATTPAAKSTPAKTTSKKAPAKRAPAKRAPAKAAATKKAPATKAPTDKAPATKTPATKTPAKQTPAKQTPAKQTPATKVPAKKAAATRSENG